MSSPMSSPMSRPPRRTPPAAPRAAFTLIELLVVIAIIAILIGILIPSLGAARRFARKGKDATHVRSIGQGMTVWGGQHDGAFPRPSELDRANLTIQVGSSEAPLVKDNTGNILSVLIYNGLFEAEQAKSPAETNDQIVVDTGYERGSPSRADGSDSGMALWDPGFAGFPGEKDTISGVSNGGRRKGENGEEFGHNSYATAFPFGERQPAWNANFNSKMVIAGNRGPRYRFKDGDVWSLDPNDPRSGGSNTLRFYSPESEWSGHLGYGDGHVEFSTTPNPAVLRVAAMGSTNETNSSFLDNVFVNEAHGGVRMGNYDATLDTRPDLGTNSFIRLWGNVSSPVGSGEAILNAVGVDGNFID